jgi:hypothetical protein
MTLSYVSVKRPYTLYRNRPSGIRGLINVAEATTEHRVFIASGNARDEQGGRELIAHL